jgi:hypothetical protein
VIYKANRSWQELAFYAALALGMSCFFYLHADPQAGIPARSALVSATGKFAWMEEHKYGTKFGLVGTARCFDYPSKADGIGEVRRALKNAGDTAISVEYLANDESPEECHEVWVLSVGDQRIRTFEETRTAWENDNRQMPWIGTMMLVLGFAFGFWARRAYRTDQQTVAADRSA